MVGAGEHTLRRRKKRSVPVEALPVEAVPVEARAGDHWTLEELMAADEHEVETAPGTPKAVEIEPLEISPVKCKQIANSFVHHTERAKQELGCKTTAGVYMARLQAAVLVDAGIGVVGKQKMGVPQFGLVYHVTSSKDISFGPLGKSSGKPCLFSDDELKDFIFCLQFRVMYLFL